MIKRDCCKDAIAALERGEMVKAVVCGSDCVQVKQRKVCTRCGVEKPLSEFNSFINANDGKSFHCTVCERDKRQEKWMDRYGFIYEKYSNRCALCGRTDSLHIHHIYGHHKEGSEDLVLVCHTCHLTKCHHGLNREKTPLPIIMAMVARQQILEVAQAALEWIDAVPRDTVLPAMPGFDRDWANDIIDRVANFPRG